MTISINDSQRSAAKVAGFAALFIMAAVVLSQFGIYNGLIVPDDAAATARNITEHELLFRIVITCSVIYSVGTVVLLTALYVILEPVNRGLALLAALFRLVVGLMWLVMAINMFDALRIVNDAAYLAVFESDRIQALSRLSLAVNFDVYYVGLPFYGLAMTVVSYLLLKSNYIPKALATFGVIGSAWCVLCAFAFLAFPGFGEIVNVWWFDSPMAAFEMVLGVWLLFKGLRPGRQELQPAFETKN